VGIGEAISIFFLSTTKFLLGIIGALALDCYWVESFLITASGGIFGVIFYLFLFEYLIDIINKRTKNVKIKFNKWRRFLIALKQKGGLLGISILTPLFLSIPLGIGLSISLGSTKRRILTFHIASIIIWSLLIFIIKFGLGYDVADTLGN
jgi:hypothetical protein